MMNPDESARLRALDLLRQAEEFAAASLGGVVSDLPEDPRQPSQLYRDYTRLTFGLEVHFLFPNLNLAGRRLVTRLLAMRNTLALRRQMGCHPGKGRSRRSQPLSRCERQLQQLRTRVQALRKTQVLTPVQRAVLSEILSRGPEDI